ncbi:MAG: acetyltransferase [candidate division WOR-3 bacterium]|nr:acetyltransferase [candidate division WOR-3 bacterium]
MTVLIVGAGKHAQVVADILLRMRERDEAVDPVGYLDDDPSLAGRKFLGLPVLGATGDFGKLAHDAVVVAVGSNAIRRRLFDQLRQAGERLFTARHPQAVVAPDVVLGDGTVVCAGVVVNTGSAVGANVILNTSCSVDHHNRIGDHVHIAPGVHLGGEVVVDEGALVGIGALVTPRRRVGAWSIVGAGLLVHHDVPAGVKTVGAAARVIGARRERDGA